MDMTVICSSTKSSLMKGRVARRQLAQVDRLVTLASPNQKLVGNLLAELLVN
jgi:hypothetical protein